MNKLTSESNIQQADAGSMEAEVADLLGRGNLPQAETLLRKSLESDPGNPRAYAFLGRIAVALNLPHFAVDYFSEAARLAPDWRAPREELAIVKSGLQEGPADPTKRAREAGHAGGAERFLLIKAWGCGFWADVSHVLGQLLVAEITGRIPIVHWGSNSLFGDGTDSNGFDVFFEGVSTVGIADLQRADLDFWPPKWNHRNLMQGEVNKWAGPFSRVSGLYSLSRPEKVIVSDFYTGVVDLKPWIPVHHELCGLSVDKLYRHLVHRYLKPRKEIIDQINSFHDKHLASSEYVAMHIRGSDKILEVRNLHELHRQYKEALDQCLSAHVGHGIFLMTDDSRVLEHFKSLYGNRIVTTDCQRTSDDRGLHLQPTKDRRRLGTEVMVDTYLAARAGIFFGNGRSNPSLMVMYLNNAPGRAVYLIGQNILHERNTFLHDW